LRRATFVGAIGVFCWFFLRFGTEWVPAGMDTNLALPPGTWCVVDRWSRGVRVGSDVFVDGPDGLLLSQVAAIDAAAVTLQHANPASLVADSRQFGPLPRAQLRGTVVVGLRPDGAMPHGR
jgi:hypothetical protein